MNTKIQIHTVLSKPILFFIGGIFFGLIIIQFFESPINEDLWFWFFSTIAQVYAAILSLVFISYYTHRTLTITRMEPTLLALSEDLHISNAKLSAVSKNPIVTTNINDLDDDDDIETYKTIQKVYEDTKKASTDANKAFEKCATFYENDLGNLRHDLKKYTILIGSILLTSIILLPLDSLNTCNETILHLLLKYNLINNKLDFVLIAGFTCFCISNTYIFLNDLITERQIDLTTKHQP